MNCNSVRELLAVIRPDSRDADQAECALATTHLEQCAECRAFFETQQQADSELGRAFRNVTVPTDFKSRLLAQLATEIAIAPAATPVAVSTAPTATVIAEPAVPTRSAKRSWNRRQLATMVSAALVLTVVGSWWFLNANQKPTLRVDQLLTIAYEPFVAKPFQASFQPELPVNEILVPEHPSATQISRVQRDGREIGVSIAYKAQLTRGAPLSVILVVIDLRQVIVPNLNTVAKSFQTAVAVYPPPHGYATKIWRGEHNLYVCYVLSRDAQHIDKLKNQSSTT